MKSKMPCPPGFMPVTKLDHATGLCGGVDVPSGWKRALVAQPREVRHLAARDQALEDHRIHPVDADHEHARPRRGVAARAIGSAASAQRGATRSRRRMRS